MNTNAVHETFSLLPADSVAYHNNPPFAGRKSKNPPMAAHLRWAEAINELFPCLLVVWIPDPR